MTWMIDGSVTVGPNAVLAFKREGYRKGDFSRSLFFQLANPLIHRGFAGIITFVSLVLCIIAEVQY